MSRSLPGSKHLAAMRDAVSGRESTWKTLTFEQFQLLTVAICVFWVGPRVYAAYTSTSLGLAADAAQHLVDTFFMVLIYFSIRAANRSSALLFPHGTGKFEAIANSALGISMLISGTGFVIVGVMRFVEPVVPENTGTGVLFLFISLLINAAIYFFSKPLERGGKPVVKFWRQLYLIDCFMKATTIALVAISEYGGIFVYLDSIAAIIIGVSMVRLAIRALKDSIWELSDRALEEGVQLAILRGLTAHFDAFDDLIDVRTRRTGGRPVIEVFLAFDENSTWAEVQNRCVRIKSQIEDEVSGARVSIVPASPLLHIGEAT